MVDVLYKCPILAIFNTHDYGEHVRITALSLLLYRFAQKMSTCMSKVGSQPMVEIRKQTKNRENLA